MSAGDTTEVRCQEKSGGLAYEVILATPTTEPPANVASPAPKATPTADDINKRLQAAEERKKRHEYQRQASVTDKLARIDEASKKRQEADQQYIQQAREQLEQKMGANVKNRENIIKGMQEKLKEHLEQVEAVQNKTRVQYAELAASIQEKQKGAEEARDENLRKTLEKLKEKEEQGEKVRAAHVEHIKQLKANMDSWEIKLKNAEEKRVKEMQKKVEMLHEHNTVKLQSAQQMAEQKTKDLAKRVEETLPEKLASAEQRRQEGIGKVVEKAREELSKVPVVRSNMEESVKMQETKVQELVQAKLVQAEERRLELIEKQREKLKERERHGEVVRQNKERVSEGDSQ
ncbi:golgin subfamily A member 6-like protein 1 isoform X2 [Pollicipes pollicipes]|nr:golgin subfamily A member 6-like protein 1 isoform X2 [Pollicipes pollicipes]XP_037077439.1 golgin subfamily A member 6-like protein 1 isoform X2 [Pollicipes pollicipes]